MSEIGAASADAALIAVKDVRINVIFFLVTFTSTDLSIGDMGESASESKPVE